MIFTSYTYLLFLIAAFLIHWSLPGRLRKPFLVFASYVFYCSWKWQYGFLLLGVSLFNWCYARWVVSRVQSMSSLVLGIMVNLGALIYFKYTYFILGNVSAIAHVLGLNWHSPTLNIILPLGISFFTFQGIAYLFDVAAGEEPLEHLLDFLLFKSLWPQLIAGPIVRLHEIREQILTPRLLDYSNVAEGSQRILFGFFKKVALADNLAAPVEMVFSSLSVPNAMDAAAAMLGFGMQIYFDFSAYSDIAIGTALLFGYRLPENFNWPYTARSPRDFWNRWHMTLSRWIRDYLFTPMSFASRKRPALMPLWLLVAMALCGLWHGAAWTFVLWGVWHGLLLVGDAFLAKKFPAPAGQPTETFTLKSFPGMIITFVLVNLGWLLFRAQSVKQALVFVRSMITVHGGVRPGILRENAVLMIGVMFAGLIFAQLIHRPAERLMSLMRQHPSRAVNWTMYLVKPAIYAAMIACIIIVDQEAQAFVYFQF
jgi:alginate O-acetyltransferase complex protein AlgI